MSLSQNKIIVRKSAPLEIDKPCVDGLLHIYKGGLLVHEAGNIGYLMPGTDVLNAKFGGIALEELHVSAAENSANGTFKVRVLAPKCGETVLMDITSNITVANEESPVYVDTDEKVDIASGILNTTGGYVGIIKQFVSTNSAWVQMI